MEKILSFIKNISPTTWIYIAIGILVLIAIIIYFSNKNKEKEKNVSSNKNLSENLSSSQTRPIFPLQYGSKGQEVGTIQRYLNSKGSKLTVDNVWGPLTDAAVLKILKVSIIDEILYNKIVTGSIPILT